MTIVRPFHTTVLAFLCLCFTLNLAAQDTIKVDRNFYRIKSHDLIIGNHLVAGEEEEFSGAAYYFLELGYARSFTAYGGHHGPSTAVLSITQAMAINREFVTATRVGMSVRGWMTTLGLYLAYYTDFEYGNLKISPEFGMGFPNFKAVMGLNIPTIYNKDFEGLEHGHYQFTLNFNLPLAKKRFDPEEMAP